MPAFTNRKPKHRNSQSFYPFARLVSHGGQTFPRAEAFRSQLIALHQGAEEERAVLHLRLAVRSRNTSSPITLSRFRTSQRYQGRTAAADLAFSIAAYAQGWTEADIAAALSCDYLSRDPSRNPSSLLHSPHDCESHAMGDLA